MFFKQLLLLFLCSLSLTSVADDYKIYSDDISATKGTNTSVLNVFMTNEETISALQFDISFPVGIDVFYGENEDEDMVYFITKGERAKTDHTASYNRLADRKYRVMVSSPTNATFKETAANKIKPIAVITLDVASGAQCGVKDVAISNVVLSHYDVETRVTQPYYPDNTTSFIAVKPTFGVETSEDAGILSIATAEGTKLDAALYNTLTSGKSDAVIDLRASEIADGVTASDIQNAGATLYYLPNESAIEGENIIVDGVCSKLNVQDGKDFVLPVGFTAEQAIYMRPLSYKYGTICLPFVLESDATVQYYKLSAVSADKMTFEPVASVKAGEPAVFKSLGGNELTINTTDVAVAQGNKEKVQEVSSWTIKGTYSAIDNNPEDCENSIYYIAEDKFWYANVTFPVAAFRGWFETLNAVGTKPHALTIVDSEENVTGIEYIENADGTVDAIFDLLGKRLSVQQNGINIINNHKILKK